MRLKRLLAGTLSVTIALSGAFSTQMSAKAAELTAPSSAPNRAEILDIFQAYNTDVYNFVNAQMNYGDDFMRWFDYSRENTKVSELETAVHETYHGYTFHSAGFSTYETIACGNGVEYSISKPSRVTPTQSMAKDIEASLRTSRYSTYAGPGASASANGDGIYGLMNEFSAYYWGMNIMDSLVPYFRENASDAAGWKAYATQLPNNMCAYTEFKYWMLRYMMYLRDNSPSEYEAALNNQNLCTAYKHTEENFAQQIAADRAELSGINDLISQYGYKISDVGSLIMFFQNGKGVGASYSDYNKLKAELDKPEFVAMDALIKSHSSNPNGTFTWQRSKGTRGGQEPVVNPVVPSVDPVVPGDQVDTDVDPFDDSYVPSMIEDKIVYPDTTADPSTLDCKFFHQGGNSYWYERGVRQGTLNDPKGVFGFGTNRGREICDMETAAWYWCDSVYNGAKACNKEVWMPYIYQNEKSWSDAEIKSNAAASGNMAAQVERDIKAGTGKWVRYNANGKMFKGWYKVTGSEAQIYPSQVGNIYYYDPKTGLMAKGDLEINGVTYHFDDVTGVLQR